MKLRLERNRKMLWVCLLAILFAGCRHAHDITGICQGTLIVPHGTPLRIVLQFARDESGTRTATFCSIDHGSEGYRANSITMQDPAVEFALNLVQASYEGKLSVDGNFITGTWIQGSQLPLNFQRATKATAWPVDASPHTSQFVTVEPGVKFQVLDWSGIGRPLVFLAVLDNTAHVFDRFAPTFTGKYHVYGVTPPRVWRLQRPHPQRPQLLLRPSRRRCSYRHPRPKAAKARPRRVGQGGLTIRDFWIIYQRSNG